MHTLLELYTAIRDQIEQEDELIYHRTYWLLTTHSILFAAYAVLLTVPTKSRYELIANYLVNNLPWFGLIVSVINYAATLAAIEAIEVLKRHYQLKLNSLPDPLRLPTLVSESFIKWFGYVPARTLAPIFFLAWAMIMCHSGQSRHSHLKPVLIGVPLAGILWSWSQDIVRDRRFRHLRRSPLLRVLRQRIGGNGWHRTMIMLNVCFLLALTLLCSFVASKLINPVTTSTPPVAVKYIPTPILVPPVTWKPAISTTFQPPRA